MGVPEPEETNIVYSSLYYECFFLIQRQGQCCIAEDACLYRHRLMGVPEPEGRQNIERRGCRAEDACLCGHRPRGKCQSA